jgi:hypothetical protein
MINKAVTPVRVENDSHQLPTLASQFVDVRVIHTSLLDDNVIFPLLHDVSPFEVSLSGR